METTRALLFLVGCIGTRAAAAYVAYAHPRYLGVMAPIAAVIAIGFAVIYIGGLRTTGPEVFGERIWWNDLRPVHAALYALFAYYAARGSPHAWKLLAADAALGLGAWTVTRLRPPP